MLILVSTIKYASSQDVPIEVIGKDTFPMVIIYHGIPLAAFTDNQMTTVAQVFESNFFYASEVQVYKETETELNSIIKQKDLQIDTIQSQLKLCKTAENLLKKNEAEYVANSKDQDKKYAALKQKSNLRVAGGTIGSFLGGAAFGVLLGLFLHK